MMGHLLVGDLRAGAKAAVRSVSLSESDMDIPFTALYRGVIYLGARWSRDRRQYCFQSVRSALSWKRSKRDNFLPSFFPLL